MIFGNHSSEWRVRFAAIKYHLVHDRTAASRSTEYGDFCWIAAKCADVPLYPVQSSSLIQETGIGNAIIPNFCAREETKGVESVLDRHIDDATLGLVDESVAWIRF